MATRAMQIVLAWVLMIGAWEGAYRIIGWKSWQFPAPSHVLDATLGMLNVRTYFGEPVQDGWPWHKPGAPEHVSTIKGHAVLPQAILVSGARLLLGFTLSLILGIAL